MGGGFTARALSDAGRDVLLIDYGNEDISSQRKHKALKRSRDSAI